VTSYSLSAPNAAPGIYLCAVWDAAVPFAQYGISSAIVWQLPASGSINVGGVLAMA
jgi:hypothetical protein